MEFKPLYREKPTNQFSKHLAVCFKGRTTLISKKVIEALGNPGYLNFFYAAEEGILKISPGNDGLDSWRVYSPGPSNAAKITPFHCFGEIGIRVVYIKNGSAYVKICNVHKKGE